MPAKGLAREMKFAILLPAVCLMLAAGRGEQVAQRQEPFVPVAVTYRSDGSRDRARAAADLATIRELGFNSVRVPLPWVASEPARGTYDFEALNQTLELASQQGLRLSVRLDISSLPRWLLRQYPDGRFVPELKPSAAQPVGACLDHPGVRAAVQAFVAAATANAARHTAWHAIDLGSDLPDGFCRCPHTERRFREWLTAAFGPEPRPASSAASDRAAFVALQRADHLALLTAAASARGAHSASSAVRAPSILRNLLGEPPGQDDWLMSTVVDHYGTAVPPETGRASVLRPSGLAPSRLALALDGLRSATRDKGWLMTDGVPAAPASDLRLLTWAAIARGARGVTYGDWRGMAEGARTPIGWDGTIADRVRAAGALARVIGRNPALFGPLRPRPAQIAIAYDPRLTAVASRALVDIYRVFFERNTAVDFIHLDEIAAGMAGRYRLVVADSLSTLPAGAAEALKAYAAAGGTLITSSTPASSDQSLIQAASRAGVSPEVRIEGATGPVETRFLESADVLMLIGLNHADTPQRVKMTFTPDTQEAIWQNMETGSAVNFVAGPDGPTYTYSFGPRDALVLMIRKSVR